MVPSERFSDLRRTSGGSKISFRAHSMSVSTANHIRKAVYGMVSSVAVDPGSVEVRANTSTTNNERLALVLQMVPMHVEDPGSFNCTAYSVSMQVKNDGDMPMLATSRHLRISCDPGGGDVEALVESMVLPHPVTGAYMPLAVLLPGNEISLKARLVAGTAARDGAPFQNHMCTYRYDGDCGPDGVCDHIDFTVESFVSRSGSSVVEAAMGELARRCREMGGAFAVRRVRENPTVFEASAPDVDGIACRMLQERVWDHEKVEYAGAGRLHYLRDESRLLFILRGGGGSLEDARAFLEEQCALLADGMERMLADFSAFARRSEQQVVPCARTALSDITNAFGALRIAAGRR